MSVSPLSPESYVELCKTVSSAYTKRRDTYDASQNQIAFFSLAALRRSYSKEERETYEQRYEVWREIDGTEATGVAGNVAANLNGDSGDVVGGLKARQEEKWAEFLTVFQSMRQKYHRSYAHQLDAMTQDELASQTVAKIIKLINEMPSGAYLEENKAIVEFAQKALANSGALYNFSSPFLHYVGSALRNTYLRYLKQIGRERKLQVPLEKIENFALVSEPMVDDEQDAIEKAQLEQLKEQLPQLLVALESLPRKRRLVAIYTLAGRPQFRLAVKMAAIALPAAFPQLKEYATDEEIAEALGITANSVRANRNYAHRDLNGQNPALGALFLVLSNVHF